MIILVGTALSGSCRRSARGASDRFDSPPAEAVFRMISAERTTGPADAYAMRRIAVAAAGSLERAGTCSIPSWRRFG